MTVVIPTYRRPAGLRRCLTALGSQRPGFDWDVLVVDNDPAGDGKAAEQACGELRAARPDVLVTRLVEQQPGAAHARNRGIAAAEGDVVAMLDDDVWPQPGWLAAIAGPVLAGEVAGAGGRVVLDPTASRPRWFSDSSVGGYLTAHDLGPRPHDLDYYAELVVTANAAFRRESLLRIGGFDPAFGPRGKVQLVGDDAHLTRQVLRLGQRVVWCPEAVVIHELPSSRLRLRWLLKRAWWQGRSDWRLERLEFTGRRFGGRWAGMVQVGHWLRQELAARRAEGPFRPAVAVHLACDLIRMAGRTREVLALSAGRTGIT